jgi:predicted membrane protein
VRVSVSFLCCIVYHLSIFFDIFVYYASVLFLTSLLFSILLIGIKDSYDSPEIRKKIEEDKARSTNNPMANRVNDENSAKEASLQNENSRFIGGQQSTTKQMVQQQDVQLGNLGTALDRVHQQAR